MRERIRNAIRGFGPVTDAERDALIVAADQAQVMVVGTNIVSQWGVSKTPVDPSGKGRI